MKEEKQELTLRQQVGAMALSEKTGIEIRNVGEAWSFSELLSRANLLPVQGSKGQISVEAATVCMIAGARLGLDPFQSVQGIASINGRPAIWGDAMVAVCKASGKLEYLKKEVVKGDTADKCGVKVTVKRTDEAEPYVEIFTVGDAKRANLWGKAGPWQAYPQRMLFARARAYALRDAFADVLRGFRSVEEERDAPIDVTDEVTVSPSPAEEPKAVAKRAEVRTIDDIASLFDGEGEEAKDEGQGEGGLGEGEEAK